MVATFALLAVLFAGVGVDDPKNQAAPIHGGTFTRHGCSPPDVDGDYCRAVGDWVSDDGALIKRDVYLNGDADTASVRASFRPTGHPMTSGTTS